MHRKSLARRIAPLTLGIVLALLTPFSLAADSLFFDPAPLLWCIFGAFLGVFVFPLCVAFSKSAEVRYTYWGLSIASIGAVAIYVLTTLYQENREREERAVGLAMDAEAFAQYCKTNRRFVVHPERMDRSVVILVRHERIEGGPEWIGDARKIAHRIGSNQDFCKNSAKITIKAEESASRNLSAVPEQPEYVPCGDEAKGLTSQDVPLELEMLIRDSFESRKGVGKVPWGVTVMYRSSVTLTRVQDNKLVAEGDFFFVGPRITQIEERCPKPDVEFLRLLAEALPKA